MSKVKNAREVISLVESETNLSIQDFIKQSNWEEEPELVENTLRGNVTDEQEEYLQSKLSGLSHKRDSRSAEEYGRELLVNWLLEDVIVSILENDSTITVNRSGEDANREFLENTTADPDLEVSIGAEEYLVEIIVDYTGFWKRSGNIDLRDNKYNHLQKSTNGLVMGIDFDDNTVFIDKPSVLNSEYLNHHPVWNKPAYRGNESEVEFTDFSELNEELKEQADAL